MRALSLAGPVPSISSARKLGLWLGPVAFVVISLLLPEVLGAPSRALCAAGVVAWMCIWWFTEAVNVAVTSLLPFGLFAVTGVYDGPVAARLTESLRPAADAYLLLFLGGMVIGAAMEESGLHRRIALGVIAVIGSSPRRLLAGVLVSTAVVSMWISNTATAVMMVPIAFAISAAVGAQHARYRTALMLSVAYGASVGGIATKIGSPTNSLFAGFVAEHLRLELSFVGYAALAAPILLLLLPAVWIVLWRVGRMGEAPAVCLTEKKTPLSRDERWVAFVFLAAAALWTMSDVVAHGLGVPGKHVEAAGAVIAGLVLLAVRAVSFGQLRRIPFGTLVLMAGSFALAAGMMKSGLSAVIGSALSSMTALPLVAQLAIATSATIALSAVASNTATVNVMLNVLPRSLPLLAAATLASSCDFALPAGTPPNAIVFATGAVSLRDMMRVGVLLDVVCALLVTVYALLWIA